MKKLAALLLACLAAMAQAAPTSILFVGNSYTFGRVDPVMGYNAANVHDLTQPMWLANSGGTNVFEPHPWGGVPGVFKQFTVQAGLDYDVSISARNAASLRGQFLNTNTVGWDLRGNISSRAWDKVVLQEQSDEPLPKQPGLASNPDYFKNYADKIEDFVHVGTAHSFRERDFFPGATDAAKTAACVAATGATAGTCNTLRVIPANANARAATELYLYQTWARPNLVTGAFQTSTNPATGSITRTVIPATTTFYTSLDGMTNDLRDGYQAAKNFADDDATTGFAGIAPVGQAFQRAVQEGLATPDMWAADALTDGLIDLWFDDGTHASKYGSYLSALTLFASITGLDPQLLGYYEQAARDLGISSGDAYRLQQIAAVQLGFQRIPEPGTLWLLLLALGVTGCAAQSRCRRRPGGSCLQASG